MPARLRIPSPPRFEVSLFQVRHLLSTRPFKLVSIACHINILFLRWSDGSAADLLNWDQGEPNDFNHGQRCVDFYPWNGMFYNTILLARYSVQ